VYNNRGKLPGGMRLGSSEKEKKNIYIIPNESKSNQINKVANEMK
jgi:hypothetical protein